jgi:hypothetical protein
MTLQEFQALPICPDHLSKELCAMWWAYQDDWDAAHELVQDLSTNEAAWIHAYLHRWEGDISNARYWYQRAKKTFCNDTIAVERDIITKTLLAFYS